MSPASTLAAYAAGLALVFGGAVAVGTAVGPVGTAAEDRGSDVDHSQMTDMTGTTEDGR